MRKFLALVAVLLGLGPTGTYAASSIIPNLLPVGIPPNAGLINNNFNAAINDIDALQNLNEGVTAPSNPHLGYFWLSTPQNATTYPLNLWDGTKWVAVAALDSVNHIWMPPIGGGVPPTVLSATTTDLGAVPQATVSISGINTIQSFGSSAPAGTIKVLLFTAATPLVNSASLILPQGENRTQTVGSNLTALALGGGVWQVLFDSDIVAPVINITGGAVATNNAAMSALASTATNFVTRLGFANAGDAPPLGYEPSSAACSLNSGAGDGGSQVPSSDGKCWLAKFSGAMDIREWGADPTATSDSTVAIAAATAYCGTVAGVVTPANGAYLNISANIAIPKNCTWDSGIWVGNQNGTSNSTTVFSTKPAIWLAPAFTIQLANNAAFKNTAIFQYGLTLPTNLRTAYQGIASFAGTAITPTGYNTHVDDVFIIGFNQCYSYNNGQRPYIDHLFADCTNVINLNNIQDVGIIRAVHAWPYYTGNQTWSVISNPISAIANNGSGAIRVTIGSTASFVTGDTVEIGGNTSGDTGARGRWVVTVIDSTHLDLQNSQWAPSTTCSWGGEFVLGVQAMACTSVNSLWTGMTVTATGIPGGTTISGIDQHSNSVYLSQAATSGESGMSVSFGQGGSYTGDGVLYQNTIYRTGTFLNVTNSAEIKFTDLFAFGWDTSYHTGASGGGQVNVWAHCTDCSDDHYSPPGDPVPVSILIDGTAALGTWTGGQLNGAGTAVVMNTTNGNGNTIEGAWLSTNPGLGMAISAQQGRLILSGDTMYNAQISILDTISRVGLTGDDFSGTKLLFNTTNGFAIVRTDIDNSTVFGSSEGAVYQKPCVSANPAGFQLAFGGVSTGITYAANNNACFYRVVGGYVIVTFDMLLTSKGSATGTATLTNLPLTAQTISVGTAAVGSIFGTMSGLTGSIIAYAEPSTTTVALFEPGSTGGVALADTNFTNTSHIYGTLTYPIQ